MVQVPLVVRWVEALPFSVNFVSKITNAACQWRYIPEKTLKEREDRIKGFTVPLTIIWLVVHMCGEATL
jgi:hypothetical protein